MAESGTLVDAAQAYDEYAPQYDRLLDENRINGYMRRVTSVALLSTFRSGDHILELGCGTGDEALLLARHGCTVDAFDPSPRMIELATRKASAHPLARNIRFFVGTAAEVARHLSERSSFDGAYASFSLSYEPDLHQVARSLALLIKPGGKLVLAVMNKICAVELFTAILSGRPWLAGRRLKGHSLHKVGEHRTSIYPRTTTNVREDFAPHFVLEDVRALPAVLPPHYANRALKRLPAIVDMLTVIDPVVGSLPFFRSLGDHNLVRLRRTV